MTINKNRTYSSDGGYAASNKQKEYVPKSVAKQALQKWRAIFPVEKKSAISEWLRSMEDNSDLLDKKALCQSKE